jgi:cell wall-associated NlpC family hydrolase
MSNWYDKYTGLPYKHLGYDPIEGIDCFNLCKYVYKQELDIDIPYFASDYCNIVDDDWYVKTHDQFILKAANDPSLGWVSVTEPKLYDVIVMSLGSTHVANHCALYLERNRMLQTMLKHKSWVAPYGTYYKQYTVGVYRWKTLQN